MKSTILIFSFITCYIFIGKICHSHEKLFFKCETTTVLSVNKQGELKQFLPGNINFEIKNKILSFGKLGYITDESVPITFVNPDKFYSLEPAQSIFFENGLFHHVVSTFEGLTAIQAKCTVKDIKKE